MSLRAPQVPWQSISSRYHGLLRRSAPRKDSIFLSLRAPHRGAWQSMANWILRSTASQDPSRTPAGVITNHRRPRGNPTAFVAPWIASSLRSSQRLHFPVFASPALRGVAIHGVEAASAFSIWFRYSARLSGIYFNFYFGFPPCSPCPPWLNGVNLQAYVPLPVAG